MGHYLGHYNDLTEVIIIFLDSGCTGISYQNVYQVKKKILEYIGNKSSILLIVPEGVAVTAVSSKCSQSGRGNSSGILVLGLK